MNETYDFYIAGRMRNKEKILEICDILDDLQISYYCFLKNEQSHQSAGLDINKNPEDLAKEFEGMPLDSKSVQVIFEADLEGIRKSKNLLLVLPAGKSSHIEAGIAYGWGKKCYPIGEYDVTDSLYSIFEEIFKDKNELREFLEKYA